jgi:hypothetical protein
MRRNMRCILQTSPVKRCPISPKLAIFSRKSGSYLIAWLVAFVLQSVVQPVLALIRAPAQTVEETP